MCIDSGLNVAMNVQEFEKQINTDTSSFNIRRDWDSIEKPVSMKLKVCLLGDGAVGKTSLIRRFVKNMFTDDYLITVGTKTCKKHLIIKKTEFKRDIHLTLIIWDLMGQVSFRKLLHPNFLRGAKGAMVVCDLTREETLDHLDDWIDTLYVEGRAMPSVFVANKSDLGDLLGGYIHIVQLLVGGSPLIWLFYGVPSQGDDH